MFAFIKRTSWIKNIMKQKSFQGEITIGAKSADIIGRDETAVQSAILLAGSRGISKVRILKGVYKCKNSIFLKSGIELSGENNETILQRYPPVKSPVLRSIHHYERVVPVKWPDLFPIGCGIKIKGMGWRSKTEVFVRATVIAKNGHELLVDKPYLGENFWLEEGRVNISTLVPVIYGENLNNLSINKIQIDGKIPFKGMNYADGAGIYLKNCRQVNLRDIYSHHNNGDGIGFEFSNDVTVDNCLLENNVLPIHAGSGSLRMNVRNNKLINNKDGFYFCWGIQHGILEENEIRNNSTYGISVGFHDSHNIIRRNRVVDNKQVGIFFRAGQHPSQSPCDDLVEDNLIENNGPKDGALGIKVSFGNNIRISRNKIRENRRGKDTVGILVEKTARKVRIERNLTSGFAKDVFDCRK